MRVPYSWLCEHCDPGIPVEGLAELLAMKSTEVDRVSRLGPPSPDGFVIGKVLSVEPHPNADRLTVCAVDTGPSERRIVCGAPNVAAGQTVPVALPGAMMPGGQKLEPAELRGVVSEGMILSEAELEIGEDAAGIAVLDDGAAPGTALSEVLPLGEPVLELELTPNRIDLFGVYGVAREVHAITGAPLAEPPWSDDAKASGEGRVEDYASVAVEVPDLCPRFTARVFTDVRIGPSPLWLKARLRAAGQRPINSIVDITNYVMLLTSQPLHAFDLDRVPGGELIIRTAGQGERMTTLDGVERSFDSDAVLVCDRDGPSGIAGIMGGEHSEVSESTTRVLLEVATWNGVNILRTSRKLGLRSEASTRFEKQLHPELALRAQRIAAQLFIDICGARMVPGTIDAVAEFPSPHRIRLRADRVEDLLGMVVEAEQSASYLGRLGFGVRRRRNHLDVEVPVDRHYDVTRETDLIEEVGRVHGLDEHLPATLPEAMGQVGRLSRDQLLRRRAEDVIRDLGFHGAVALSLTDPGMAGRLRIAEDDPRRAGIGVRNPLSGEHSVLRTTLLGTLLDAAAYNLARGAERVALFDSSRVYLREPARGAVEGGFAGQRPPPAFEPHRLAALAVGSLTAPGWREPEREADFFALKGVLEALARQLDVELAVEEGSEPFLHPGRSARVLLGGKPGGWMGELHPVVARSWDLEGGAAFELDLATLSAASAWGGETYEDVTTYPAVYQDVAVVVPEEVPAARVREAVLEGGGELLRSAEVFDLFRGEQLGEGQKSLALRLSFRAPDRTLTDQEVAERRTAIRETVRGIGGSLRE
jgi:phenylalanyl-tRNA synthetase beta chain